MDNACQTQPRNHRWIHPSFLLVLLIAAWAGCEPASKSWSTTTPDAGGTEPHAGHDHGHDHSDSGGHGHSNSSDHGHEAKHGGHLIDIGRGHQYHAELVDDHETNSVAIYIMDSQLRPLEIDEPEISLSLTTDQGTETFQLTATETGQSTKFSSGEAALMEMIDAEEVQGKIRLKIKSKPFSATFTHPQHDHAGHAGHDH